MMKLQQYGKIQTHKLEECGRKVELDVVICVIIVSYLLMYKQKKILGLNLCL